MPHLHISRTQHGQSFIKNPKKCAYWQKCKTINIGNQSYKTHCTTVLESNLNKKMTNKKCLFYLTITSQQTSLGCYLAHQRCADFLKFYLQTVHICQSVIHFCNCSIKNCRITACLRIASMNMT